MSHYVRNMMSIFKSVLRRWISAVPGVVSTLLSGYLKKHKELPMLAMWGDGYVNYLDLDYHPTFDVLISQFIT